MDTTWKTARWSWDSGSEGPAIAPLLRYHAGRPAYAVQVLRQKGGATPLFSNDVHSCPIKDEEDWNAWLDNVRTCLHTYLWKHSVAPLLLLTIDT